MNLVRSLRSLLLVGYVSATPLLGGAGLMTTGLITASLATSLAASPAFAQQEQMMRTLTVRGEGKASVATSLTQVQLGVEVQGKTASEVQQEAARRSAAVVAFLQSRRVDKLQTAGISLNPQYDYSNSRQQIIGYIASNTVSFRLPTEQAGEILDQAVQAGATRIENVSFVADDAAMEAARQQAIQQAVRNAQGQAAAVLTSLGLSQQEIVGIQVDGASPPPPILMRQMATADAAAPSTPVIGGEQEVMASVTLQIRY